MKKEDLNQAYENIKIDQYEKNKIFNNIMTKKKKKNTWIFSFGTVLFASLLIIMLYYPKINNPVNNSVDVALENNYRKEIIVSSKQFLQANKIDITKLKDGENLEIDSKDIISKDEYKTCSGKLIIKKYNDDYSYTTDVSCGNTVGKEIEFKIFAGNLIDVVEVENNIATITRINKKLYEDGTLKDSDIAITIFNDSGDILWNTKIESVYQEDSNVKLYGISKIKDYYIVLVNMEKMINNKTAQYHTHKLVINNEGNIISNEEIMVNGNTVYADRYITANDEASIYQIASEGQFLILKLNKDDYKIIELPFINEFNDETSLITNSNVYLYNDNYFYGNIYLKGFNGSEYYKCQTVFKLDEFGNVVWQKDITLNIEKEEDYYITKMFNLNDLLYIIYQSDNGDRLLLEYDEEFNLLNKININDLIDEVLFFNNLRFENEEFIFEMTKNEEHYFIKTDKNFKVLKEINVENNLISEKYDWNHSYYSRLKQEEVNMIYSVGNNIVDSDSILLAFYK